MSGSAKSLIKICRLCLDNSSKQMHNIFDEGLSNKVIMLSGLDVSGS